MRWVLLKGGHVFDPEDRGAADVLVVGGEIVAVGPGLAAPTGVGEGEIVDVSGHILLPGLIDPHIHVMGASGMGGPTTRSTDLQIERIAGVGVTTVVSPLGADSLSRDIPCLLARAAALECEGISAYCYTGGWKNPVPTLTGDPQADVAYVDRVLGVKVAIAEPMAPAYTTEELCRLAHAAWTGGRLAGKRSVLHTHAGRPAGWPRSHPGSSAADGHPGGPTGGDACESQPRPLATGDGVCQGGREHRSDDDAAARDESPPRDSGGPGAAGSSGGRACPQGG